MTACAIETVRLGTGSGAGSGSGSGTGAGPGPGSLTISADGSYAARLAPAGGRGPDAGGGAGNDPGWGVPEEAGGAGGAGGAAGVAWFVERWTLGGPEPYAVPLPLAQPEEAEADVLPLADGRVLVRRRVAERHTLSLLYPTGPGTGEVQLGAVECPALTLLPPAPDGRSAYALAVGAHSTAIWLVAGGAFGPEHVAEVRGRCSGGVWLDRAGRLLALDRETDGVLKTVAVDLGRGGEVTPLLQIAEGSDDRLLLAEPDSGLLLVRSDAPGEDRLGWGVLGSHRPVRFPECLRVGEAGGVAVTPFAAQPGQVLMPEACAVALEIGGDPASGAGSWLGVWRPAERRMTQLPAPVGWLAGSGLWTREGVLRLPCSTAAAPCSVVGVGVPAAGAAEAGPEVAVGAGVAAGAAGALESPGSPGARRGDVPGAPGGAPGSAPGLVAAPKPVPLQQAPLTGQVFTRQPVAG